MKTTVWQPVAAAGLALTGLQAFASDLSYTFVDFGALNADSSAIGMQSPTLAQIVAVGPGEGDGLTVAGSLAVGSRFYLAGSYESAVMDFDGSLMSPLASVSVSGSYNLISGRTAFGYLRPIGDTFDVLAEVTYDTLEYDFGSFVGESFDVDDGGLGFGIGARWNPRSSVEVFAMAHGSSVADVDLTARQIDSGIRFSAGLRWYFFEDLGLGFRYQGGDFDSLTVSLRFGFGELRAGGN